jgi:hypothetical protein
MIAYFPLLIADFIKNNTRFRMQQAAEWRLGENTRARARGPSRTLAECRENTPKIDYQSSSKGESPPSIRRSRTSLNDGPCSPYSVRCPGQNNQTVLGLPGEVFRSRATGNTTHLVHTTRS